MPTRRPATALELRTRRLIERRHRGRDHAIEQAELAEALEIFGADPTRKVQDIVKAMIQELRWPVGSTCREPFGVYWIVSRDELLESRSQIAARVASQEERIAAYDWMDEHYFSGQQTLPSSPRRTTCRFCRRALGWAQADFCSSGCEDLFAIEQARLAVPA